MTKLIDQINELKATAEARAAAKEEQDRRDRAEADASEIKLGKEYGEHHIPEYTKKILKYAEDGSARELEVRVQVNAEAKALTLWESAFANTVTQHFEDQGLTVEQKQSTTSVASGKRYTTTLFISW